MSSELWPLIDWHWAVYLRTNVRTLENWEQGRAQPNAQAVVLIRMVQRYPDTVKRLAAI